MEPRTRGQARSALALLALACRGGGDSNTPAVRAPQPPARETTAIAPAPSASPVPDTANLLQTIYHSLRSLGADRRAIRTRLGEPRAATTNTQPDPNDSSAVDTLVRWRYDRLDFTFLLVGREILAETRASASYVPVASLAKELATVEAAVARLGPPAWTQMSGDTTVLGYSELEADGGAENSITLHFVKKHLVQIGAVPFLD